MSDSGKKRKSSSSSKSHKKSSSRDAKRSRKEEPMPKRPRTAFLLFSVDKRESVTKANPELGFGDIAKEVSLLWKSCRDSEKQKYNNLAAEDKQRYERQMADFNDKKRAKEERKRAKKEKKKKSKSKKSKKSRKHETSSEGSASESESEQDRSEDNRSNDSGSDSD